MDRTPRAPGRACRLRPESSRLIADGGHFVYLVRCADGTFYCGYSTDPRRRVQAHNAGRGAKILRGKLPVRLAYLRRFARKGDALRFEIALKARSHEEKRRFALRWSARRTVS